MSEISHQILPDKSNKAGNSTYERPGSEHIETSPDQ